MSAHRLVTVVGLAVLLAACTTTASPGDEPTSGPPSGNEDVLVSSAVPYAAAPEGWAEPVLDLYLPVDPGALPLAVIVPDAGADPTGKDYVGLARDLAAAGVVAVVAHWGAAGPELGGVAGRALGDLVAQAEQVTAEVSCALVVARARVGWREDGSSRPFVVVGHGAGANAAAMATLSTTRAFDPCFATGGVPHVSAALLWDGDWLGAAFDDDLGPGIASLLPAYSPWPAVDSLRTTTYVEVGVNANRLVGLDVPVDPTGRYLTERDPGGSMTEDLSRVGAFDNGGVDPVDVARAFAIGLRDAGLQSRERELHGEGDPATLGPRVRALIVQSVVELSRP